MPYVTEQAAYHEGTGWNQVSRRACSSPSLDLVYRR